MTDAHEDDFGRDRMVARIVQSMINGLFGQALLNACAEKLGVSGEEADALIAEARQRLTIATETNHDEEVGKAVSRLNDIYASARLQNKFRESLDAQRELNRLLGLYGEGDNAGAGDEDLRDQVARAMAYLMPLGLSRKKKVDLPELCRLAATRIMNAEGSK